MFHVPMWKYRGWAWGKAKGMEELEQRCVETWIATEHRDGTQVGKTGVGTSKRGLDLVSSLLVVMVGLLIVATETVKSIAVDLGPDGADWIQNQMWNHRSVCACSNL